MKDQKINLNEKEFLANIEEFFSSRCVKNHLRFIDHWMELMLGGKKSKRWAKPSDLYYSYEKIDELFQCCNQLLQDPQILTQIQDSTTVTSKHINNERYALEYFPNQLAKKELSSPINVIKRVFKYNNLMYYQQTLKEWLAGGLSDSYTSENEDFIIPLYSHLKKLVSACWLIHERAITKNSFASPNYPNPLVKYALLEPLLFSTKEADDPFLKIEDFFNFTNLSGYREELQEWYFTAITENFATKNPSDLFFIHNQYLSLIQAGYLIAAKNLYYTPKISKNETNTMAQWLLAVRDRRIKENKLAYSDEEPHVLSMAERANPLIYCKEALTLKKISKLRFGLSQWLEAGFSKSSSIHGLEPKYIYELYLSLQKLTEAFYLVITTNAETAILPITNISHEIQPDLQS